MSERVFSITVSTDTLVESSSTTTTTTTTSLNNPTLTHSNIAGSSVNGNGNANASGDETSGTSSSYYSNSSASSSAENISTVENGDLSIFTFVTPAPGQRSGSQLADVDYNDHSFNNSYFSSSSPASRHCVNSSDRCNSHCHKPSYYGSGTNNHFAVDPFRMDGSHMYRYKGCQNHLLSDSYVRLLPHVSDGILLRSMEKGVLFPVVHWQTKSSENFSQSENGQNVVFNQGVYKELKRVIPPDVWLQRGSTNSSTSKRQRPTWLIIGYKSLEKTLDSSLEATWKEWTGVRHIYLNLRHDFDIHKISFLHRIHPQANLDLFMYLVLVEIGNVDDSNLIWLLDFVQRTRVERMKGFITVYCEVEQELSSIHDEYLKYLSSSSKGSTSKSKSNGKLAKGEEEEEESKHKLKKSSSLPSSSPSSTSSSSSSCNSSADADGLPIVDTNALSLELNLKFIEKLLEEIHTPPLNDYF